MTVRRQLLQPAFLLFLTIISLALIIPSAAGAEMGGPEGGNYRTSPHQPTLSLPTDILRVAQAPETEKEKPEEKPAAPRPPEPLPPEPLPPTPPVPPEVERPKPEKPVEVLLLERGAILLPRGTFQIEPSIEYSHFSSDRVAVNGFTLFEAIVIGTIRVDRLDRDILTSSLTGRFGVLDRLQLEARVPYVYRVDDEVLGVGTTNERRRTIRDWDIGDVDGSILAQPLIGWGAVPDVVLKVRGKTRTGKDTFEIGTERTGPGELRLEEPPTGTGFYTVSPGLTLSWRTDPVVFFTGGNYHFNLKRSPGGNVGEIDPGDAIEMFAGLNIALSERVSVNISFVDQITKSTKVDGRRRAGTSFNDARLTLGTSIGLAPNFTLLVSASAGLTEQSPDFSFTISLPITFKLF